MKLIVATNNAHKLKEIKSILGGEFEEILSLKEAGAELKAEENGSTFEENAIIKARGVGASSMAVLADDSGLCVEVLGGAPGVKSARYASEGEENADDASNRRKLLKEMEGKEERKAKFVCAVALLWGEELYTAEGETEGRILTDERGERGFGYDSIFYSDELGKSFGEAEEEEKNGVSHRGRALKKLLEKLKKDD
jgi:XTP/dITP diphosphohydrolase